MDKTIEEICCGMPNMLEYFSQIDGTIRKQKDRKLKGKLKKQRTQVLKILNRLTIVDIRIVYYLSEILDGDRYFIYLILARLYRKDCDLKNLQQGEKKFYDIFEYI